MQRTQIITNVLEVQQVSTLAHFIAIRQTQQLLFMQQQIRAQHLAALQVS